MTESKQYQTIENNKRENPCPFCGKPNPSGDHIQTQHPMEAGESPEMSLDAVAGYSYYLMIPLLMD